MGSVFCTVYAQVFASLHVYKHRVTRILVSLSYVPFGFRVCFHTHTRTHTHTHTHTHTGPGKISGVSDSPSSYEDRVSRTVNSCCCTNILDHAINSFTLPSTCVCNMHLPHVHVHVTCIPTCVWVLSWKSLLKGISCEVVHHTLGILYNYIHGQSLQLHITSCACVPQCAQSLLYHEMQSVAWQPKFERPISLGVGHCS